MEELNEQEKLLIRKLLDNFLKQCFKNSNYDEFIDFQIEAKSITHKLQLDIIEL